MCLLVRRAQQSNKGNEAAKAKLLVFAAQLAQAAKGLGGRVFLARFNGLQRQLAYAKLCSHFVDTKPLFVSDKPKQPCGIELIRHSEVEFYVCWYAGMRSEELRFPMLQIIGISAVGVGA